MLRRLASVVVLLTLAVIASGPMYASSPSAVLNRHAAPDPPLNSDVRVRMANWTAQWWQWIWSSPVHTSPTSSTFQNPLFQSGAVDCKAADVTDPQGGRILFLAGTTVPSPPPTERTCTVPPGVSLFFPLLNQEYDNVGCCDPGTPPFTFTVEELKSLVAAAMDSPQELHASVDGVAVPAYRLKSEVFAYQMPAIDNVYQYFGATVPGANWPSTTVYPAVSDGYWALVRPLSRGPHTIQFGGITNTGFTVAVTYHITVAP
mgnify:CR=1 FL=1